MLKRWWRNWRWRRKRDAYIDQVLEFRRIPREEQ